MSLAREIMKQWRIEMLLEARGVKNIHLLGRYNHTSARPALTEHSHPDCIEICFMVKGCQTYLVRGKSYRITGGDIFLTYPGEHHSTGGVPEEKGVLYWMILRVRREEPLFLNLPEAQSAALVDALLKIRPRMFAGTSKMKEHLDAVTNQFHEKASPLNTLSMSNQVAAFLLEVLAASRSAPTEGRMRPLQPVLNYIQEHLAEPVSVTGLARLAGLSTPRFKARFKQVTGIPPAEYMLRARVEEAARRLQAGKSNITEVAFDLGFSTSQYFATVFKRFTGQTPSDFKAGIPLAVVGRGPKLKAAP